MLRAELLKIRSLPTPRNTTLIVLATILIASVVVLIVSPEQGNEAYSRVPEAASNITVTIGAMVLGAWMIGLEFASKTIRLVATVQPNRLRFVFTKLVATKLLLIAFAVLCLSFAFAAAALLSSIGSTTFDGGQVFKQILGTLVIALLWGIFAFGLTLLLRSYTGGIVGTLVLALGLDPILQIIPSVGKYSFGSASESISNWISGDPTSLGIWMALLAALAWVLAINALGCLRFVARDLK